MTTSKPSKVSVAVVLVTLATVLVTGYTVFQEFDGSYYEQICEERGAEVVNSNSINHGGLHCMHPDGRLTHPIASSPSPHQPWYTVGSMPLLITSAVVAVLVFVFGCLKRFTEQ